MDHIGSVKKGWFRQAQLKKVGSHRINQKILILILSLNTNTISNWSNKKDSCTVAIQQFLFRMLLHCETTENECATAAHTIVNQKIRNDYYCGQFLGFPPLTDVQFTNLYTCSQPT